MQTNEVSSTDTVPHYALAHSDDLLSELIFIALFYDSKVQKYSLILTKI